MQSENKILGEILQAANAAEVVITSYEIVKFTGKIEVAADSTKLAEMDCVFETIQITDHTYEYWYKLFDNLNNPKPNEK